MNNDWRLSETILLDAALVLLPVVVVLYAAVLVLLGMQFAGKRRRTS